MTIVPDNLASLKDKLEGRTRREAQGIAESLVVAAALDELQHSPDGDAIKTAWELQGGASFTATMLLGLGGLAMMLGQKILHPIQGAFAAGYFLAKNPNWKPMLDPEVQAFINTLPEEARPEIFRD